MPDGKTFERAFTRAFLWFVKDRLLAGWYPTMAKKPGAERSGDADRAIVDAAHERGVPSISVEGLKTDGSFDEKKPVRKYGRERSVTVLSPRQFFEGKMDEAKEIAFFLRRFNKHAPSYLEGQRRRFGHDGSSSLLRTMLGLYELVLLGKGPDGRKVKVTLP